MTLPVILVPEFWIGQIGRQNYLIGLGMFTPRLISALLLTASAVLGRAEASPPADSTQVLGAVTAPLRAGHHRLGPVTATKPIHLPDQTYLLDDEVEIPDEPEDDDPDDLGDAVESDDRPIPISLAADLDVPFFALGLEIPSSYVLVRPAPLERNHLFLCLCRLLI